MNNKQKCMGTSALFICNFSTSKLNKNPNFLKFPFHDVVELENLPENCGQRWFYLVFMYLNLA